MTDSSTAELPVKPSLAAALREAKELEMRDSLEFRLARRVLEEGRLEVVEAVTDRLLAAIEAKRELLERQEWLAQRRVFLLQERLDSPEIEEALMIAKFELDKALTSLKAYQAGLERRNKSFAYVEAAIDIRIKLRDKVLSARSMLEKLVAERPQLRNELRFLETQLARIQGQTLHGYTPDLNLLDAVYSELEKHMSEGIEAQSRDQGQLEKVATAFLARFGDQLTLSEADDLKQRLQRVLEGSNPTERWELWTRIREKQTALSKPLSVPALARKKSTGAKPEQVRESWDVLMELAELDNPEKELELRQRLARTLGMVASKRKNSMKPIKESLRKLIATENGSDG